MDSDRVYFLGSNDMAYGINLNKIETMEIPEYSSIDINDAIEYYEIKKYFDDGVHSSVWTDQQHQDYCNKSKKLFGLTMRFFNSLEDANIVQQFNAIEDYQYRKVFWQLFDKRKLYNKISETVFNAILQSQKISLHNILLHKSIVMKFGEAIRNHILGSFENVRYIIHVYEQNYTKLEKLFLPEELTPEDKCQFIEAYIDSDFPNLNYIETISLMQPSRELPISDALRLKAKRKNQELSKKVFENGVFFSYGIELSFSPEQEEKKKAEIVDRKFSVSYSTKWLLDTLDYPSILKNFIYIFEYVDYPQMRCLHIAKESESGVFERSMQSKSSRMYSVNYAFQLADGLAQMQMHAYYGFLNQNNIRYEDVLEWFFTKYLQDEFGCPEMRASFPSEGTSYCEKCITLCSLLDSVLKQFTLFVEYGEIDFELLTMMQGSKKFGDIPSLVENKYIYGIGNTLNNLKNTMFSDQCMLSFVPRIHNEGKTYSRLFDLLYNEKIYLSDYHEHFIPTVKWLEENGLITIDDGGLIQLGDIYKIAILKDLFDSGVISKWHFDPQAFSTMQEWIDAGMLVERTSLLTQQEVNYFDYILNNAEYDNGLQLRNKYAHGNQLAITDENEHKNNYYYFLRIFTILAIKINDDFILREQLSRTQNQE